MTIKNLSTKTVTRKQAYEQWIVGLRLERKEAEEIKARQCVCPLCKAIWSGFLSLSTRGMGRT